MITGTFKNSVYYTETKVKVFRAEETEEKRLNCVIRRR